MIVRPAPLTRFRNPLAPIHLLTGDCPSPPSGLRTKGESSGSGRPSAFDMVGGSVKIRSGKSRTLNSRYITNPIRIFLGIIKFSPGFKPPDSLPSEDPLLFVIQIPLIKSRGCDNPIIHKIQPQSRNGPVSLCVKPPRKS